MKDAKIGSSKVETGFHESPKLVPRIVDAEGSRIDNEYCRIQQDVCEPAEGGSGRISISDCAVRRGRSLIGREDIAVMPIDEESESELPSESESESEPESESEWNSEDEPGEDDDDEEEESSLSDSSSSE